MKYEQSNKEEEKCYGLSVEPTKKEMPMKCNVQEPSKIS